MNMEVKRNLIAGQWVEGSGSRQNENPSDKNDPVGTFTSATADQVNDAVAAAKKAFAAWSRTSPQVRSDILDKAGNVLAMFSLYWNEEHEPDERELRNLDLCAELAGRHVERSASAEAMRRASWPAASLTRRWSSL